MNPQTRPITGQTGDGVVKQPSLGSWTDSGIQSMGQQTGHAGITPAGSAGQLGNTPKADPEKLECDGYQEKEQQPKTCTEGPDTETVDSTSPYRALKATMGNIQKGLNQISRWSTEANEEIDITFNTHEGKSDVDLTKVFKNLKLIIPMAVQLMESGPGLQNDFPFYKIMNRDTANGDRMDQPGVAAQRNAVSRKTEPSQADQTTLNLKLLQNRGSASIKSSRLASHTSAETQVKAETKALQAVTNVQAPSLIVMPKTPYTDARVVSQPEDSQDTQIINQFTQLNFTEAAHSTTNSSAAAMVPPTTPVSQSRVLTINQIPQHLNNNKFLADFNGINEVDQNCLYKDFASAAATAVNPLQNSIIINEGTQQNSSGSTKGPLQSSSISTEGPLQSSSGSSEGPLQNSSGSTESPLLSSSGSIDGPLQKSSGSTKNPLQNSSGSTKDPLQNSSGSTKDPLQRNIKGPLQSSSGNTDSPLQNSSGGTKGPLHNSTERPLQNSSVSSEGPLQNSSGSTEGPLQNSSGSTEGPLQSSSGSTKDPLHYSSASTESPLQNSSVSIEGPLQNSSGSTEGTLQNSSGSTKGPLQNSSISTEGPLQNSSEDPQINRSVSNEFEGPQHNNNVFLLSADAAPLQRLPSKQSARRAICKATSKALCRTVVTAPRGLCSTAVAAPRGLCRTAVAAVRALCRTAEPLQWLSRKQNKTSSIFYLYKILPISHSVGIIVRDNHSVGTCFRLGSNPYVITPHHVAYNAILHRPDGLGNAHVHFDHLHVSLRFPIKCIEFASTSECLDYCILKLDVPVDRLLQFQCLLPGLGHVVRPIGDSEKLHIIGCPQWDNSNFMDPACPILNPSKVLSDLARLNINLAAKESDLLKSHERLTYSTIFGQRSSGSVVIDDRGCIVAMQIQGFPSYGQSRVEQGVKMSAIRADLRYHRPKLWEAFFPPETYNPP